MSEINKKIIDEFDLLIKDLQYKLNNNKIDKSKITQYRFKLQHFKKALQIIKLFPKKIKNGNDLKDIKGIGKGTIERIDEILDNNKLSEINRATISNIQKNSNLINELSKVINIGPKVASQLIKKYKIKSIEELKKKVNDGEIEVNDKIKIGLKYYGVFEVNIPRKEIDKYNELLQDILQEIHPNLIITIAGSYRRGKKISNDIDVLVTHKDIKNNKAYSKIKINYLNELIKILKKKKIIVDDLTDTDNETKYMGFSKLPRRKIRRIDIRFVPFDYYYSALLYFTGSYELNTQMRQIAKKLNYKLNEYGLFKKKSDDTFSENPIKIKSEKDIFKKLKLDYLEPTERG